MPSLDVVVRDICAGCARDGQVITEVLAAFVRKDGKSAGTISMPRNTKVTKVWSLK